MINSHLLYQLSYRGTAYFNFYNNKKASVRTIFYGL